MTTELEQKWLDHFTRLDELMIANTAAIRALGQKRLLGGDVGGGAYLSTLAEVRKRIESGQWVPYEVKSLSLTTARSDFPIPIQGDFIHAWTDGAYDGIGVRLGRQQNDLIYFKRRNPVSGFPFWQIFLTHTAQAGKTLDLLIGKEASAQAATAEVDVTSTQKFYSLRSDKDTHFTGAIAANAKEDEDIAGLLANKIRITGVALQADENLDFRVIFWKTDGFDDTDLDLDRFCGEVEIDLPTNGYQIGAANQYYLDMRGLEIDYEDEDGTKELHVSLQALTAGGKAAGAAGEVVLDIYYEVRS